MTASSYILLESKRHLIANDLIGVFDNQVFVY